MRVFVCAAEVVDTVENPSMLKADGEKGSYLRTLPLTLRMKQYKSPHQRASTHTGHGRQGARAETPAGGPQRGGQRDELPGDPAAHEGGHLPARHHATAAAGA